MAKEDYFGRLVELMEVLRGPSGCPWDREQTRESLKPMLIEEAYEVLDALDGEDADELCEELGDLLFQVVFHSQIASERGEFDAQEVCRRVYEKMVRRHPHVFGDRFFADSQELLKNWEDIKTAEKEASGRPSRKKESLLDGVSMRQPAMYVAYQLTSKASRVGFDWDDLKGIREKLDEEFAELEEALQEGRAKQIKDELGDLLFAAVNAARFLEIDPETALNRANAKFASRFKRMEESFSRRGRELKDVNLSEMEREWDRLKGAAAPKAGSEG
ncbi:MAG TPA: nucleoside triphosphate pyrophosphohydrolase [Acidobacteriota bacterium]|nr:nucleoside triphosphate pyrophosphohydrolase [Acidobacteriota bacterium]